MNLFDAQGWAIHGNVVDSGSLRTVPIEGSFSANTNGRLEYYYNGVAPAGDTLTGHVSYTITNTDGDVWFIVMPNGSGGQYNKQLAHQGDAVPITGSFDLAVQIPEGSSFVEVGTYNQQYATSEGPAPSGYGSMGSVVVPAPLVPPVAPDELLSTTEGTPVSVVPAITQGDSPVTPDSLAVVAEPTHGSVAISGATMTYTPTAGYFGADSFTYKATVAGVDSNIATVDVVIHRLVLSPSVRQQTTHRINRDVDSLVACYVRGEAGRMDLSKADISVIVRPYGKRNTLVTLGASGDANGAIKFTVPADTFAAGGPGFDYGYGLRYQPRNLAQFDVIASGALVYQAIMEIA